MKEAIGLLLLRLVFGGAMLVAHGWPKLTSFFKLMQTFPDPLGVGSSVSLGLAVFAEVFCAALVVFGVKTRITAIPLVITMIVAFFIVHGADPFAKKEMALLYMAAFTAMALLGSGRYSIDALLSKKRRV